MADNDYTHIASIIEAAMPHADIRTRITMDIMSKLLALMGCLQTLKKTNMAACGFEDQKINVEGMLTAVRPLCYGKELAIVDQILGMFNAKRMFDTYKQYMDAMKDTNGFADSPFGDFASGDSSGNSSEGSSSGFDISAFLNGFAGNTSFSDVKAKEPDKESSSDDSDSFAKMYDALKALMPPE